MKLVLASASVSRYDLLEKAGIHPELVIKTDVDETPLKKEKPKDYCKRVTVDKLKAAVKLLPDDGEFAIIVADSIGVIGGRILVKPEDNDDHEKMLRSISGRRHKLITTIVIAKFENGQFFKILQKQVTTIVGVKRLENSEIKSYISCGEGQGKACGYSIAGVFSRYVKFIGGSYTNIIGLPISETYNLLKTIGYKI